MGHVSDSRMGSPAGPEGFYPELEEFLSVPGRTLLIKGPPGVGKTTLALSLLNRFCSQGGLQDRPSGVYFSTRVPEEALQTQFPWVKFELLRVEDLRLSSVEGFLGEVLKKMRAGSTVIVLDSWDAYAKEMDEKERLKTEKAVVSAASSSNSRMIFVSEETRTVTLDYIVDGVVELASETVDSRLFRVSYLRKLRGLAIKHHAKPYTLLGASIRAFNIYEEPDYAYMRRLKPVGDFDGKYSFGSPSLDEKLGGLPYRATLSLEYTSEVPESAIAALTLPTLVNFVLAGRSVLVVPPPSVSSQILAKWFLNALGEEAFEQRLALYHEGSPPESYIKKAFFTLPDSIDESAEELEEATERLRSASVDGRVLHIVSLSQLENRYPGEPAKLVDLLGKSIRRAFEALDAQIYLVEGQSPLKPKVVGMSHMYFKMRVKNGVVLVYGEKPYTPLYVLEYEGRDPLKPKVTEVV